MVVKWWDPLAILHEPQLASGWDPELKKESIRSSTSLSYWVCSSPTHSGNWAWVTSEAHESVHGSPDQGKHLSCGLCCWTAEGSWWGSPLLCLTRISPDSGKPPSRLTNSQPRYFSISRHFSPLKAHCYRPFLPILTNQIKGGKLWPTVWLDSSLILISDYL